MKLMMTAVMFVLPLLASAKVVAPEEASVAAGGQFVGGGLEGSTLGDPSVAAPEGSVHDPILATHSASKAAAAEKDEVPAPEKRLYKGISGHCNDGTIVVGTSIGSVGGAIVGAIVGLILGQPIPGAKIGATIGAGLGATRSSGWDSSC